MNLILLFFLLSIFFFISGIILGIINFRLFNLVGERNTELENIDKNLKVISEFAGELESIYRVSNSLNLSVNANPYETFKNLQHLDSWVNRFLALMNEWLVRKKDGKEEEESGN